MEEEKREHDLKMKKMESEMEQVCPFQLSVKIQIFRHTKDRYIIPAVINNLKSI